MISVDGKTVPHAYLHRVKTTPNRRVYSFKKAETYHSRTWAEIHAQILGLHKAFSDAGLKRNDKVCILSQSRPEWNMADLAILTSGLITVPIYPSSSVEDTTSILKNSQPSLIFAEDNHQVQKLESALQAMASKIPIVSWTPLSGCRSLLEFAPPTHLEDWAHSLEKSVHSLEPSDVASIVYTSGTTGVPKGAVLTHQNFISELRGVVQEIPFLDEDITLTFLPFAHVLGRMESLLPVLSGICLGFAENMNSVAQNTLEIRPTLLVSVPRIYEKIFAKIQSETDSLPQGKRAVFRWAVQIGREVARLRSEHLSPSLLLSTKFRVADQLVLSKIRNKLGGRIRLTVSGGAPLSRDLCELFHACGIRILEGYGLTETTAAITVNRPEDFEFGTVGRPVGGSEIRIAPDGEIQVRGPLVFKEYYRNPEATQEVFTRDGWFCTGDIGEFSPRGFLKITDRKKELIVTSGGKKIAPQKLENLIRSSRYLSNGMVYGDQKKFLVALLTLNEISVQDWAASQGLTSYGLYQQPEVIELIEEEIRSINTILANFESIKKFRILPRDFSIDEGELTPSLKLKRRICAEKYQKLIEEMYT